jgi:hypothetical protein
VHEQWVKSEVKNVDDGEQALAFAVLVSFNQDGLSR